MNFEPTSPEVTVDDTTTRALPVASPVLVVGAVVQLFSTRLTSTHGYAAMWLLVGAAALASLPMFLRISRRSL